ncbi:hypothetical protein HY632_00100 [Candidatus Uhrbacteria bacterium]|nr:hypothetical protein [Candidatus Uhrbacteria bacterium]
MNGRQGILTMVAVAAFVGAMNIAQPETAQADPGYAWAEIDPKVPANLTDTGPITDAIEQAMQAGGKPLIRKVQQTCGVAATGRFKGRTLACVTQHARFMAEARQASARCTASLEECNRLRETAEARVRELEATAARRRGRGGTVTRDDDTGERPAVNAGLPEFRLNPNEPSPCPQGQWLFYDAEEGTTECRNPKWLTSECANPVVTNQNGRMVYICDGQGPAPGYMEIPQAPPPFLPAPIRDPPDDDGSWLSNNYGWLIAGGVAVAGGIVLLAANDWKFLDVRTVPVSP